MSSKFAEEKITWKNFPFTPLPSPQKRSNFLFSPSPILLKSFLRVLLIGPMKEFHRHFDLNRHKSGGEGLCGAYDFWTILFSFFLSNSSNLKVYISRLVGLKMNLFAQFCKASKGDLKLMIEILNAQSWNFVLK